MTSTVPPRGIIPSFLAQKKLNIMDVCFELESAEEWIPRGSKLANPLWMTSFYMVKLQCYSDGRAFVSGLKILCFIALKFTIQISNYFLMFWSSSWRNMESIYRHKHWIDWKNHGSRGSDSRILTHLVTIVLVAMNLFQLDSKVENHAPLFVHDLVKTLPIWWWYFHFKC